MNEFFDMHAVLESRGRMPILASAIDMTKNIGATMNLGYNMASLAGGDGFRKGFNIPKYAGSVGGALTVGGLVLPGAMAGAAIGMMSPGGTMVPEAAAIGAGIGLAAPLAIGAAGYGMERIGKGIVKSFSSTALDASEGVGSTIAKGAGFAGKKAGAAGLAMLNSRALARQVGAIKNFGSHIVDFKQTAEGIENVKLGWAGKAMIGVGGVAEAGKKAFHAFNESHMGTSDGQVRRATPNMPAYADNSGASGDLVFALNRNRRG